MLAARISTHTLDYAPFVKGQLARTKITLGPYVVHSRSRITRIQGFPRHWKSNVWGSGHVTDQISGGNATTPHKSSQGGVRGHLEVLQWGNPYIAYPQCSTSPNVARRARSRRPKSYGPPMPLCNTTPNVACHLRVSHATLRVTPLYRPRSASRTTTARENSRSSTLTTHPWTPDSKR